MSSKLFVSLQASDLKKQRILWIAPQRCSRKMFPKKKPKRSRRKSRRPVEALSSSKYQKIEFLSGARFLFFRDGLRPWYTHAIRKGSKYCVYLRKQKKLWIPRGDQRHIVRQKLRFLFQKSIDVFEKVQGYRG